MPPQAATVEPEEQRRAEEEEEHAADDEAHYRAGGMEEGPVESPEAGMPLGELCRLARSSLPGVLLGVVVVVVC